MVHILCNSHRNFDSTGCCKHSWGRTADVGLDLVTAGRHTAVDTVPKRLVADSDSTVVEWHPTVVVAADHDSSVEVDWDPTAVEATDLNLQICSQDNYWFKEGHGRKGNRKVPKSAIL